MNQTLDISSVSTICEICQTSYGFTSADRRSIIVMVVLTGIALLLCYVGVLWYAIRTRFIPVEKSVIAAENLHTNQAFNGNEVDDEVFEENVSNMVKTAAILPVVFTVENEKERF
jgi:hypothetical protein